MCRFQSSILITAAWKANVLHDYYVISTPRVLVTAPTDYATADLVDRTLTAYFRALIVASDPRSGNPDTTL